MDYLLGEITLFPYTFTPMGWMSCEGQILNIAQNQALYSLIGNTYGGNAAQGTFALPNLKGAEPLPNMKYYIATEGIYPQRQ
ncbi:phage tail protein [Cellulosilyticum lentocellum]|uniref:Tail Collar domain protein n=1 Tax=Cellulosilyticum lentocellum (strain ATCC 49066 / DSM 5427 / NCIMB 11756 / RHM5) TaxID=642492 RepID=F2JN48_CELLD|nr:tail fiber protein [Cellulosilyticum lentocellum]ADZ82390.1 Tail Collar domain protein [Cellulosilyticum lentocellum DSM 5427]